MYIPWSFAVNYFEAELYTQLVRSRWLDIGLLVLFCVVIIVFFDP